MLDSHSIRRRWRGSAHPRFDTPELEGKCSTPIRYAAGGGVVLTPGSIHQSWRGSARAHSIHRSWRGSARLACGLANAAYIPPQKASVNGWSVPKPMDRYLVTGLCAEVHLITEPEDPRVVVGQPCHHASKPIQPDSARCFGGSASVIW